MSALHQDFPTVMMLATKSRKPFMKMATLPSIVSEPSMAEQNAIVQAALIGVSIENATLYCRMTPCTVCAKLIIGTGIKRVVCEKKYHAGTESEEMFHQVGIELVFMSDEVQTYPSK
jgi:deoxycytidylate deaminase